MKFLCYFFIFWFSLTGCAGQMVTPPIPTEPLPTKTSFAIPTTEITKTTPSPRPSPTSTPTKWPTLTPSPSPTTYTETYPLKQVWIKFGLGYSCCSYFDSFDSIFAVPISTLVLYSDNVLLLSHPGSPISEKKLSSGEVCTLLNQLDYLGLNKINSSGINNEDPIYVGKGRDTWPTDAAYYELILNGENPKDLAIYEPVKEFVIKPVKDIMNFLGQYKPSGMKPYRPDRLAVYVQEGRNLFISTEQLVPTPWLTDVTPLSKVLNNGFYPEGEEAGKIYALFNGEFGKLFIDQGIEYSVYIRPILPDETRRGAIKTTYPFMAPFECK